MSDSGITLNLVNATDSQLTVSYSVASTTHTGQQWLNITTYAGVSNSANYNVGDPTPVITSINPNVWPAGTTTPFTISGRGFGTNPSLTITGVGVGSSSIVGTPSDTSISANVNISSSAPAGTATVTIQSHGYGGSGFQPAQGGQSNQGSNTATIQSSGAPTPQIFFLGNNISGASQPTAVLAGQQIALTAAVNLPAGVIITSQSWSIPTGTAIGGYTASTGGVGCVTPVTIPFDNTGYCGQPPSLTTSAYTFYWVQAIPVRQITYTYNASNGMSATGTATFNVGGPTAPNITATVGIMKVLPITPDNRVDPSGIPRLILLGVQRPGGEVGIQFLATANLPPANPGTFSWAQLISNDVVQVIKSTGSQTCPIMASAPPALDNNYPYGRPGGNLFTQNVQYDTVTDGPALPLGSQGEAKRTFSARMFLLWNSGLGASLPVPLASIAWQMAGDTINTLNPSLGTNSTTWTAPCSNTPTGACQVSMPTVDANQSYPTWLTAYTNAALPATCQ